MQLSGKYIEHLIKCGDVGISGLFKSTDGGTSWTELTKNPGMAKGPRW